MTETNTICHSCEIQNEHRRLKKELKMHVANITEDLNTERDLVKTEKQEKVYFCPSNKVRKEEQFYTNSSSKAGKCYWCHKEGYLNRNLHFSTWKKTDPCIFFLLETSLDVLVRIIRTSGKISEHFCEGSDFPYIEMTLVAVYEINW